MVLSEEQSPLLGSRGAEDRQTYSAQAVDNEKTTDEPAEQTNKNGESQALLPENETISWLRQTSPQVFATTVDSTLFLSLGMMVAFPAVVISALGSESNTGSLHFSIEEASWYGSLLFICQPIGSLAAGVLLQPIGCKKWMILLQIPLLASWLMVYYATSIFVLYAATGLSGFVIGLMEVPTIRYVSETSHPSLRSNLQTYASLFIPLGCTLIYFLSSLTNWRYVALICTSTPIISMIILFSIPETPIWLISKGHPEKALKSLQWLRGWTTAEMVQEEYKKLEFYSKTRLKTPIEIKESVGATDRKNASPARIVDIITDVVKDSTLDEKTAILDDERDEKSGEFKEAWQNLTKRETLVILAKCNILYVLSTFSGRQAMSPYQLQIYVDMNLPLNPNTIAILLALAAVCGTVVGIFLIDRTGKKPLGIFAFTINSICICLLGVYTMLPAVSEPSSPIRWWPVVLFTINNYTHYMGVVPVLTTYLSEILPYRGRGITTGIVASVFYLAIFVGAKTFPAIELHYGLQAIFFSYAFFCVVGALVIFFALPETDGRFLSDIEIDLTRTKSKKTSNDSQMYDDRSRLDSIIRLFSSGKT